MNHLPLLVILLPLCGGLLCPLLAKVLPGWEKRVVMWALFGAVICAVLQAGVLVKTGEPIHYWMGGFAPPYGIEFVIDGINALIICVVAAVSFLTSLYSSPFESVEKTGWLRTACYYCMISFLAVGLLGMASTGDAFTLYVFMEITALAGYGLIASGEGKGPIAAFRYLLTGTIGASFYLLGVGFLFAAAGTLNMADLAVKLADQMDSPLIVMAVACMLTGFGIKMALFPLHGWQPAAHSYAHEAADPMIAGIMIKIPAYAMIRFFYCILQGNSQVIELFMTVLGVLAVCGILYGSLKALQYDIYNKILAFSSVGQMGYIAMGIALGNYYGLVGASLHIMAHAFMKSGLFFTSGALKYRYSIHRTISLGQIYRTMPVTGMALVVFAMSMIGLPPFAGFFSKWYLALGAIEAGKPVFVAVLIVSSLLNAIYFFRIIEHLFMDERKNMPDKYHGTDAAEPAETVSKKAWLELPWQLLVPIGICALAILLIGMFHAYLISGVLSGSLLEVLAVW